MKQLIVVAIFFVFLFSCQQEEFVSYRSFSTGVRDELTGILFFDELNGVAVGGKDWTLGLHIRTEDGGISWTRDSLYDKQIYTIGRSVYSDQFLGAGIDQQIYIFHPQKTEIVKFGGYSFYRGLCFLDDRKLFLVGGESFGTGYVDVFDFETQSAKRLIELEREMDAIVRMGEDHFIAVGWGVIMISHDRGVNWDSIKMNDHWRDLFTINDTLAFAIGIGGSIIKTEDAGYTWQMMRNGNSLFVKDLPLRCVAFKNPMEGLAAGENGTVIRTVDGGKKWHSLDGFPKINYLDIMIHRGQFWMCGSEGTLLVLE
ncbi:MAG: hypothetical protein IPM48_00665 [Saprospiraceae bacterium]|nr:hypothetical protein [Saprospiraceae bacterium]